MTELEKFPGYTDYELILKRIKETGYWVNDAYIAEVANELKNTTTASPFKSFFNSFDGMRSELSVLASQGLIDGTSGDKEHNVVNYLLIADRLGLAQKLTPAELLEYLATAHESRAHWYSDQSEKQIGAGYFQAEAQRHAQMAQTLRNSIAHNFNHSQTESRGK